MTLLAVPPLLPAIHGDLSLDEKGVAILTGLPVLLLAGAAVPGSFLIAHAGARTALAAGLVLVAVAGAARGIGPSTAALFGMTFLMGTGIAVSQPALPSLVRGWFPDRVGTATAVYSNGLLVGELAAAALTVPFVLPLVQNRWELGLAAWGLPVLATAALLAAANPNAQPRPEAPPARWWPDWKRSHTWRAGLLMGCASTTYFGSNAFLPDYLKATHHPELISAALTSINLLQLPASVLVAALPGLLVGRRWPLTATGILTLAGFAGLVLMPGAPVVAWAGLLGFASALQFILGLTLPPLLAAAGDVHRLSAAMFSIGYTLAFVGPFFGGALWDTTGMAAAAFTPVAVAGLFVMVLAPGLRVPRQDPGPIAP